MSGIASGDRITREALKATVKDYTEKVLKKIPGFKHVEVSGSYNSDASKNDFGDIDLIITIESKNDKSLTKKEIVKKLLELPTNLIVPFPEGNAKGKRTYNAGELISVLFPQSGVKGKFVQIDNIISLSKEEHDFKKNFLDLPASKQGLLIGLARSAWLEYGDEALKKLNITKPKLEKNQELEFILSSSGLTLRKVTLDGFKELNREVIWESKNWKDVYNLFPTNKYNFSAPFDDLVEEVKSKGFKNPRSAKRIEGLFQSMVSVKSGEVGKPKGQQKEKDIETVKKSFGESNTTFQKYLKRIR